VTRLPTAGETLAGETLVFDMAEAAA